MNKKYLIGIATIMFSMNTYAYATNPIVFNNVDALHWSEIKDIPPGAKIAVLAGSPTKHEPFVVRIKFPANYQLPLHSHPINEYDTVISGAMYIKFAGQDKYETLLHAGDFAMLPAKVPHASYTKEETIIQISGIGPWGMIYK